MMEKYEKPEVEFVEMEDNDVICNSSCICNNPNGYGDIETDD